MEIEIKGYKVLIDDEDYEKISKYTWQRRGKYFCTCIQNTNKRITITLHRVIMDCVYNDGNQVDHINCNELDCRKGNMRICTSIQNSRNKQKRSNNTSGYKGVFWNKRIHKWMGQIDINGKHIHLGVFTCIHRAYVAYCKAALKYHGEFANYG